VQIPSQRSRIPSFCPDVHQCPEVLNCSRLHPSIHLSNAFGRSSVFNKKSNFLLRHKYRKTTLSVRTTGQHRLDAIFDKARTWRRIATVQMSGQHRLDAVLIMVFTCSRSSTVRMLGQHHLEAALIWYCVKRVMESRLHSCPSRRPQLTSGHRLEKSEKNSI